MALSLLSVLKVVPWGDVIENAPAVAGGAKKLWDKVAKKPVPAADVGSVSAPTDLQLLQQSMADLQLQMRESTALIQSLAEQNTQLIARIELNRQRLLRLFILVLVLMMALGAVIWRMVG